MGWFDSEEEIQVQSSAMQVFGNDEMPSIIQTAVAEMVFEGKDFAQSIIESSVNSRFLDFKNFLNYGKDTYHLGLPSFYFNSEAEVRGLVGPALGIEADSMVYVRTGDVNLAHVTWQVLRTTYGYDPETNALTAYELPEGATGYVDNIEVFIPGLNPEQVSQSYTWDTTSLGNSPTKPGERSDKPKLVSTTEDVPKVVVTVAYSDAAGLVHTEEFEPDIQDFLLPGFYYMAHYLTETGHEYFTYRAGEGTYPTLDTAREVEGTSMNLGSFYPVVPFIANGEYLASPELRDSTEYKEKVALMRHLSLDYQELANSIYDNAQSNDVQQAVFMLGVSLTTEHQTELSYLYSFFDKLQDNLQIQDKENLLSGWIKNDTRTDGYKLNYVEGDFDMSMTFTDLTRRVVPGTIGEVGECTSEFGTLTRDVNTGPHTTNPIGTRKLTSKVFYIRKQVLPGLVYEIAVENLRQYQRIYKGEKDHIKYDEDNFLIPLDHDLVKDLDARTRDNLLLRSMYFVVNAYDVQTIKWYESTWFGALLTFVALVLTVITLGATWEVLAAAWAVGTTAFALAVLSVLLKALVITLVTRWVAERIGPRWSLLLAVVLAVASFSVEGSGLLSAENLMAASTSLARATDAINQEEIEETLKEYERERALYEERMEEIEEIQEMLKTPVLIDAYMFIGQEPVTIPGESPSAFYERTVHNGNPGVLCYDYLHNYFDVNLQLPKANLE